jgi:hypothetical protein
MQLKNKFLPCIILQSTLVFVWNWIPDCSIAKYCYMLEQLNISEMCGRRNKNWAHCRSTTLKTGLEQMQVSGYWHVEFMKKNSDG